MVESDVIKTLCQEYIELVDAMRSGSYSTEYLHTLDSDRQWHHIRATLCEGYVMSDTKVPNIGDFARCIQCGNIIVFTGTYWDHQGENKPRHIALPVIEISKENPVQREYYRNHRTIGYKIGTCTINDEEYILLQTETRDPIACRVNELLPVSQGQRLFEVGVTFENAIKQARFLGISDEELQYIMKRELERD